VAVSIDAAARLDEGRAAVDTIAEYVWACHLLGFLHPDLTRHRHQVREWYATEDGLDLGVLDTECAALTASGAAAEQALRLQDSHFQDLSRAWQGGGAQASTDFLARHATSAVQVATGIRGAAATLARLRDSLWQAVDAKVADAVQIEGRRAGQRDVWLAAARTVSTGVGDRSAASELIDTQVKPYVVNDIGGDWLTAMRSATRAVADAYADAIDALRAEALPVFGIPGELGPAWTASSAVPGVILAAPGPGFSVAPADMPSWPPPAAPMAAGMPAGVPASGPSLGAEPIHPAVAPVEPAAPAPLSGVGSSLGSGGLPALGGTPDIGSGLAGAGQRLADLFGGLLGSSADGVPGDIGDRRADGTIDPADNGVGDPDPETDGDTGDGEKDAEEDTEETAGSDPADPADPDGAVEVTEPQPDSPPDEPAAAVVNPSPQAPPPEPIAEPLAAPAGDTPCAIAADELPQAGP
jgi:hypothetical protein